ncbi:hypothetical protein R3P38DRAFT_2812054 [Favolaschia claudopus]|uniref:F-box domain-containing protein n=1 Tax=Favolaschia claudopus TaxID=2862362 RepID=A0AAV9Z887_9AGAR
MATDAVVPYNTLPVELKERIFLFGVLSEETRIPITRERKRLALVNRDWMDTLYSTGELWRNLFLHVSMSVQHVEFLCKRAELARLAPRVHLSTRFEEESDDEEFRGADDHDDVSGWALVIRQFLPEVMVRAIALQVDTLDQYAMFILMEAAGTLHALLLISVECNVDESHDVGLEYLRLVVSTRLAALSCSKVNPLTLAPVLWARLSVLRVGRLTTVFDWNEITNFFSASSCLFELELRRVICKGDIGRKKVTLPTVRSFGVEFSDSRTLELAGSLVFRDLLAFTLQGDTAAPWNLVVRSLSPVLNTVRRFRIGSDVYSDDVADVFTELHSAEVVDIRLGGYNFLNDIAGELAHRRPVIPRLKSWIVDSAGFLTYVKVCNLFAWPGDGLLVYESLEDGQFVEWKERVGGCTINRVQCIPV